MIICYSYNKSTRRNEIIKDFKPSENNWLVRAERDGIILYFKTIAAYNRWAGTTCPVSAHYINVRKAYRGYSLTSNLY